MYREDDFRLIISSATLDAEKFSHYFDDCSIFMIPGKTDIYTYLCINICICIYICIYIYVHIYMYIYKYMCKYVHIYMYIYIYIYIYKSLFR
jgi:hypothetical protein